jgi:hypothetical protein
MSKPHTIWKGSQYEHTVPTVADRIAQTVVALTLEPRTESIFHDDSFGYRPGRSALQAVERCRQRCFRTDWVLDLDIAQFFDSVPHDLMVKAVEANTDQPWVLLYVKRWLVAPMQFPDGTLQQRDRGTPQGSLCAAAHNPPYEQRWVMRSAWRWSPVGAVAVTERCAYPGRDQSVASQLSSSGFWFHSARSAVTTSS